MVPGGTNYSAMDSLGGPLLGGTNYSMTDALLVNLCDQYLFDKHALIFSTYHPGGCAVEIVVSG